jgi:hypothetical protein
MWVVATYQSTSLFSLKPATATASGGRTLLVPTPYAVKMALLDVACRLIGVDAAGKAWDNWLGGAQVALRPAEHVVVNNTFIRILRPPKQPKPGQPFQHTIAYREYAQIAPDFGLALQVEANEQIDLVTRWFAHINYLGKRGSFVQLQQEPSWVDGLPTGWIKVGAPLEDGFALDALLTQLDDTGDGATFERVSIYSGKRMTMGKQRVLHYVALPYQRVASSRGYTHYRLKPDSEEEG